MALILQKFGGTSLANVDRIKSVAQRVVKEVEQGNQVVVVVSAMAGVTSQLVGWTHQCVHHQFTASEYDVVVSSGEQVTAGLMALALNDLGIESRSWMSWQLPIYTNNHHKNAEIMRIDTQSLREEMGKGRVAVVTGFQGLSPQNRVTTIGRGGSDYTAVALAAALQADRCDIYTDVDGVYTADPRLITDAQKLDELSYQDVLDLAGYGAKVLHPQSVVCAQLGGIPLRVLSSFNHNEGTVIGSVARQLDYLGVTSRCDRAMFMIKLPRENKNICAELQKAFMDSCVELDYTCDFEPEEDYLILLVSKDDQEEAESLLLEYNKAHKDKLESITTYSRVAQVALVGSITQVDTLASQVMDDLSEKNIDCYKMRKNAKALTLLLPVDKMEEAVKTLHSRYILKQTRSKKEVA
ncbi:MAG: aspartate kinase [Alphaproteobacteria bacterium]|nr:aspartate kinase [Alphaproteobacteria bacterium]